MIFSDKRWIKYATAGLVTAALGKPCARIQDANVLKNVSNFSWSGSGYCRAG
jgi:hypothetical protein